jgi:PUA domain protein
LVPRSQGHVQILVVNNVPLFFQERDGPWFPTLRVLHQYPDMMPKLRADQGAIKFVLSGANIMCPGLTSPGATIHNEVRMRMGHCSSRVLRQQACSALRA